jgi:hypothetical protein
LRRFEGLDFVMISGVFLRWIGPGAKGIDNRKPQNCIECMKRK